MFDYLYGAVVSLVIFVFLIGIGFGIFLLKGLPFIWHLLKPWLHHITG